MLFLLFLYLISQGHWDLLGSGTLCHPLTAQVSTWHTVCVWLLTANHNVLQEYSATLLVSHLFIPLSPFRLETDYDFAFESAGFKNSHPSFPVPPPPPPYSDCHFLLRLFVYMFASPLDCELWVGRNGI